MVLEDVTKRPPVFPTCSLWEHYHYLERNWCMREHFDSGDPLTQYSLNSRKFSRNIIIKKSGIMHGTPIINNCESLLLLLHPFRGWFAVPFTGGTASQLQGTLLCWNNPSPRWNKQNQLPLTTGLRSCSAFLLCTWSTAAQFLHPRYTLPSWSAHISETTTVSHTSNQLHPKENPTSILKADRSG